MNYCNYILNVLNKQPDGFIIPNQKEFYNLDTQKFFRAIYKLIEKGILQKRNCAGVAYEYNEKKERK